jgi:hypothetical protein
LQRHDIIKKRIDNLGNVIESRKDGVGAPKVCFLTFNLKRCTGETVLFLFPSHSSPLELFTSFYLRKFEIYFS